MSLRNALWTERKKKLERLYGIFSANAELISQFTPLCGNGNEKDTVSYLKSLKAETDFEAYSPVKCDRVSFLSDETETVTGALSSASWGIKKNVPVTLISNVNNEKVLSALAEIINATIDEENFITVEKESSLPLIRLIKNTETAYIDRSNIFEKSEYIAKAVAFENGAASYPNKRLATEEALKDFLVYLLTEKGGRYVSEAETEKVLEYGNGKAGISASDLLKHTGLAKTEKEKFLITEKEIPILPLPILSIEVQDRGKIRKEIQKSASQRRKQPEIFDFGVSINKNRRSYNGFR